MLPAAEMKQLDDLVQAGEARSYSFTAENDMTCLVLEGFVLPAGVSENQTDLLLRLPPGFPDAVPDMFWCDPPVKRADGTPFEAADNMEPYLGRTWQRFSRHLVAGEWKPGVDSLDTFIVLIRKTLAEGLRKAA